MDTVCGPNAVLEAIRGERPVSRIEVLRGGKSVKVALVVAGAKKRGIPVRWSSKEQLDRLVRGRHQGVVALVGAFRPERDPEAVLDRIEGPPLVVILDGIEDPRNLGAVVRTSECAGAHAIFIPRRRTAPFSETTFRAAAGALEYLPVVEVSNISELLRLLKRRGLWIFGLAGEASQPLGSLDFSLPTGLVFGSEGRGLARLVRQRCDGLVSIPVFGRLDSLNVSVSVGVALYEAIRSRSDLAPWNCGRPFEDTRSRG